ncbi:hypothetical protein MASR2M70_12000 [Bacillota bacterium]
MNNQITVPMIEAEYAKYKYCLAKLDDAWGRLPEGYLHTITGFGEDRHYRYLPPSGPGKPGSLTYLDESQQALIDALMYKKSISSDISTMHHNMCLFPGFLHLYIPYEVMSEELERLSMATEYMLIRRRRLISYRLGRRIKE